MPDPSPRRRPLTTTVTVVHDAVRARLWPLPVAAVFVALFAGTGVPLVDAAVDDSLPSWVTGLVFGGGPSAARDVLAAIAGALMTVTSLTFSLTVVTLQLASSQFSPRQDVHGRRCRPGGAGALPRHLHVLPHRPADGAGLTR